MSHGSALFSFALPLILLRHCDFFHVAAVRNIVFFTSLRGLPEEESSRVHLIIITDIWRRAVAGWSVGVDCFPPRHVFLFLVLVQTMLREQI